MPDSSKTHATILKKMDKCFPGREEIVCPSKGVRVSVEKQRGTKEHGLSIEEKKSEYGYSIANLAEWVGLESGKVNWLWEIETLSPNVFQGLL